MNMRLHSIFFMFSVLLLESLSVNNNNVVSAVRLRATRSKRSRENIQRTADVRHGRKDDNKNATKSQALPPNTTILGGGDKDGDKIRKKDLSTNNTATLAFAPHSSKKLHAPKRNPHNSCDNPDGNPCGPETVCKDLANGKGFECLPPQNDVEDCPFKCSSSMMCAQVNDPRFKDRKHFACICKPGYIQPNPFLPCQLKK